MKLGTGPRRVLLFGALALTLVAVKWVDSNDSGGAEGAREASRMTRPYREAANGRSGSGRARADSASVSIDLSRLERAPSGKVSDAFASRNWEPPPPPMSVREMREREAPPPPPPPPQAPPLPFTYLGMLAESGRTTVFLARGTRDIAAAVGETIDGTYRVEAITPERIELTYLPLSQRQSLSLGNP